MTAPAPDFDAAREAYETAQAELRYLIDNPNKAIPAAEYRIQVVAAGLAVTRAHTKMMGAWG